MICLVRDSEHRGVIINSGDSEGAGRLRTSDTLNLSHGPLLSRLPGLSTMGDHITDELRPDMPVFIPRLSSECGE